MKKKWTVFYWNLIGGSLYFYKEVEVKTRSRPTSPITLHDSRYIFFTSQDTKPRGNILLGAMELNKQVEHNDAKFCFELKTEKNVFLFDAGDAETHESWIKAIEENLKKDPCPPLTKEKRQSKTPQQHYLIPPPPLTFLSWNSSYDGLKKEYGEQSGRIGYWKEGDPI